MFFHGGLQPHKALEHPPAAIAKWPLGCSKKALCDARIPTIRINPKRARGFARALGLLDKIDACVLALFGATLSIAPDRPKEKALQEIEARLTRRQQLTAALPEPGQLKTLSAIRHDPGMKDFYQRLVQVGNPKKIALVIARRVLLTLANAVFRSGDPYLCSLDRLADFGNTPAARAFP